MSRVLTYRKREKMREKLCKHQETIFDIASGTHFSTCRNMDCRHHCAPVSKLLCESCGMREDPGPVEQQIMESLKEIYDVEELELRPDAERERLFELYCSKCSFLNKETKICGSCGCTVSAPIDEYIKYASFHCPLELW